MTLRRSLLLPLALLLTCILAPSSGMTADAVGIKKLPFDSGNLPKAIQLKGKTVIGARWVDQLGENILVVTETGAFPSKGKDSEGSDAELYGYHFINRGGSWSQLWKIQDFERNCEFDIDMSYLPGTLTITDLDADGIAETVFSYKMTCTSDVSPSYMKLMMHEGADKYAIRGNMVLSKEYNTEPAFPPEMNVDPAFAKAPASFKTYAIQQWQAHREQTSF